MTAKSLPHPLGESGSARVPAPVLDRGVRLRLMAAGGILCSCFALLVGRAYVLQVRMNEQYLAMAEEQYLRELEMPVYRGRVLDRIDTELAASTEADSVYANPRLLRAGAEQPPAEVVRSLAAALKMDRREVLRRLRTDRYFTWLKRHVAPDEAKAVRELNLKGVALVREPRRYYPNRGLAGPVLGWTNVDARGVEGVELAYDRWLKGSRAAVPSLQDASGQKLLTAGLGDAARDRGHDVYLTLDKFIQFKLEQALEEGVAQARAKAGVAVALDPHNGEILAMASVPSVNPNDPGTARERGVRNRPVTDPFEPGSTLKPFSIGAVVEAGLVRPEQEWDCEGGQWQLGKAVIHDAEREGVLTTTQVLARSSNICTAKIARRLGRDGVGRFLRSLGFGASTGVDLPGERGGILRPAAQWGDVTFATISFGQGMTATPLQLATALAAYANGGTLYRPHILRKVVDPKGQVVVEGKAEGRRVVSEETARTMRSMLRAVMQKKGTGEKLDIPGYPAAGKTGTAQKVDPATRRYSPEFWASSFMGFAPVDAPRLVLYVMIDEPQGSHYGAAVAGPVFVKVMSAALPYLGVAPQASPAGEAPAADAPAAASAPAGPVAEDEEPEGPLLPRDRLQGADRVPDFRGLGLGDAVALAQRAGLRLKVQGSGLVVGQVPTPGSARRGPACQLKLAPPP